MDSRKIWSGKDRAGLYFLAVPALLLWVVFSLYPSLGNFYYCFFETNGIPGTAMKYVGLRNFSWALTLDLEFTAKALLNGFKYVLLCALPQNIIAMFAAVLLSQKIRGRNFYRAVFFFPQVIGSMVVAMAWSLILQPNGPFNSALRSIGLDPFAKVWLGDLKWTIIAVSAVQIWVSAGYAMVIYVAGLQNIPLEIYEAALVDGANPWKRFRHVTLPLVMPAVTINTLLSITGSLSLFDIPYLLTRGGPLHSSETMPLLIFDKFMSGYHGYGSALAVLMFGIVAVIAIIQTTVMRRREVEM